MPKRRKKQRNATPTRPAHPAQGPAAGRDIPSAPTLFRFNVLDQRTYKLLRKIPAALKPVLWVRDRERVEQVRQASTPAALLDIAPQATGLAETEWEDRMGRLGPEVIPLIVERLQQAHTLRDADARTTLREKLIGHLRWRGDAGADALLAAFDALDDYGRSLACVVLGLLKAHAAAGRIWDYYQKVARKPRDSYLAGALWGLIDLGDERAGGALADLLRRGVVFYERYGFLALAGDTRAVIPLLEAMIAVRADDRDEPLMALAAIAHRIGREAVLAEIDKIAPPSEPREAREDLADRILGPTSEAVEEYFELFYRGLRPEDLVQALGR